MLNSTILVQFPRTHFSSPLPFSVARTGGERTTPWQTITLLFAGQDTSAATLSWTMHLLSLPENRHYLAEVSLPDPFVRGGAAAE